jgi:hypothetical protein
VGWVRGWGVRCEGGAQTADPLNEEALVDTRKESTGKGKETEVSGEIRDKRAPGAATLLLSALRQAYSLCQRTLADGVRAQEGVAGKRERGSKAQSGKRPKPKL